MYIEHTLYRTTNVKALTKFPLKNLKNLQKFNYSYHLYQVLISARLPYMQLDIAKH